MSETVRLVLTAVQVLICVVVVLSVLFQSSKGEGVGDLGGSVPFLGKAKGRSLDAKLERITAYSATAFLVLTFVLAVL